MRAPGIRKLPFVLAALAAGCAAGPSVEAVSARRVGQSADGTAIHVVLELHNPNEAPVELTSWDYSVSVNDRTAYSGQWITALTLPPKATMRTELPALVPAGLGDPADASWRIGGSLGYRATGSLDKLLYQLGVNRLSTGFGTSGTGVAAGAGPGGSPTGKAPANAVPAGG
ncbi:MAG: LEA type 2 family protein [Planctomycetes bacterium]|nr:LEA type 2 family protein [Planctomycetota bacterium]